METLSNKTGITQHQDKEQANPNELLMSWIRCVKFKESEKTAMNVKLLKHDNFLNPRLLIKTNDFTQENDSVTVNVQMTLKGLKELNKFTFYAIKAITEVINEREALKETADTQTEQK